MAQFGFIFDPLKCVGCHACAIACKAEQNTPVGVRYRRVVYHEQGTFAGVGDAAFKRQPVSMACFHCAEPSCVEACPSGAMHKDEATGIVLVDQSLCIGCRRCAAACPYGAPQFNRETRKMEKCTGCWNRIIDESGGFKENVRPACVASCPARALTFAVKDEWGGGTAPANYYDRSKTKPSVDFE
jgi:anaerobic dimethyl sulfoxide reductase subunit B